jgi:hypothetical protein
MQRLAAASFEVSYGFPPKTADPKEQLEDAEIIADMGRLLDAGIALANGSAAEASKLELTDDETVLLLETIKDLTPSTQGDLDEIQISGRLLGPGKRPATLNHDSRRKVNHQLKSRKSTKERDEPFVVSGTITAADQDLNTFKLRNVGAAEGTGFADVDELTFLYKDHLFDLVMEAFVSLDIAIVVGNRDAKGRLVALDIEIYSQSDLEGTT